MQDKFIQTVGQTILESGMLEKNDTVLAGVSGGPDSVALVLALMALKNEYRLKIGVAHINHQLRGDDAKRDEAFAKDFAEACGLPFFLKQADVKSYARINRLSLEDAGRKVRYEFFKETAEGSGYTKIATGHHRDDNAELILINLFRGSGPSGLCGIPPMREGRIIRPLIQVSKEEIKTFLKMENQDYMEDDSNEDPRFLRNRIRHQLIPLLESEYNPEIVDSLDRLSRILRQEETYWEKITNKAMASCITSKERDVLTLSRSGLAGLDPAVLNRVLRQAIEIVKTDLKRISLLHISTVIQFCLETDTGNSLDLPGQIRIYKTRDTITVKKESKPLRELGKEQKALKNNLRNQSSHGKAEK